MTSYERIARSARRRLMLDHLQRHASLWLLFALGLSLLLVLADRVFSLGLSPVLVTAGPAGAALGLALASAWVSRPTPLQALSRVDGTMRLHDALGTAISFRKADPERPLPPGMQAMRELTNRRAEALAGSVKLRRALPLRDAERWWLTCFAAVLVAGAAFFLPSFNLFAEEPGRPTQEIDERQAKQREQAADAVQSLRTSLEESAAADPLLQERLVQLERLSRELEGAKDPDSLLKQTAGEFHDLAERIEKRSREQRRRFSEESRRFERLPAPQQRHARDLADSLRDQNLPRALEALGELEQELDELTPEERQQLAEDLKRLAEYLSLPKPEEREEPTPSQAAADFLREQGLSEPDAEQLSELDDKESLREALEERGFDPLTADRLAEQALDERAQREAEQEAEQSLRDLADALEEAARDVEPPHSDAQEEEPPAPEPTTEQTDDPQEQADQADGEDPGRDDQQQESGRDGESAGTESQETAEGAEQVESQQVESEQAEAEQADEERTETEQREQEAGEIADDEDETRADDEKRLEEVREEPAETVCEEGTEQLGERSEEGVCEKEGVGACEQTAEGTCDQEGAGEVGDGAGEGSRGMERLKKALEQMGEERRNSEQQRGISQEARRKAEELLDNLSPQERARLARWAEQMERQRRVSEQPQEKPDYETEAVDVRRRGSQDRVVAQWDREPDPGEEHSTRAPRTTEEIRQAQQAADRAIEEQVFPSRMNNVVRRYFQLWLERSESEQGEGPQAQETEAAATSGSQGGE